MPSSCESRWNFPSLNGLLTGADGGSSASNFRGDPIRAIGKENLQNPIDARQDVNIPVRVEFSVFSVPADQFPGQADLQNAILKAKETAKPEGNSREESFFSAAENYVTLSEIPFMRISDFNTSGLKGSNAHLNDRAAIRNSNWLHLVHGMGMTTKRNGDGGSHGKGKSAAIANSALSTIFYSTIDVDDNRAFQGVAYLPLFIDDNDKPHNGVGFFGIPDEENSPIRDCVSLDPTFVRTEPGTDIYIAGFCNQDDWEDRLLVCVLNEYLLAISKEILVVKIGDTIIDQSHLSELIAKYSEICKRLDLDANDNYADACWDAITNPELPADVDHIDIEGMPAALQMFVKTGVGPRKTDQIRQIGMRICAKDGKRQFPFPFIACLFISGTEINQFLAGLEDETHSKWEPSRAGNEQKAAERCLRRISKYINEKIGELYLISKDKKLDAEGMEEYIPIDLDEVDSNGDPMETPKTNIADVRIRKYSPPNKTDEYNTAGDDGQEVNFPVPENPPQPTPNPKPPEPEPKPGPQPEPGPQPDPAPKPKPFEAPESTVPQPKPNRVLRMKRQNSIGCNGIYTLALQSQEDHDRAYVQIILSGEDGDEMPQITSAHIKPSGQEIMIQNDLIGPISLSATNVTKVTIETAEKTAYSLGVNVFAN